MFISDLGLATAQSRGSIQRVEIELDKVIVEQYSQLIYQKHFPVMGWLALNPQPRPW